MSPRLASEVTSITWVAHRAGGVLAPNALNHRAATDGEASPLRCIVRLGLIGL